MGSSGCLILWHRLAYLCDAIAHGAILGAVCAAIVNLPIELGVLGVTLLIGLLLCHRSDLSHDVKLMVGGYGSIGIAFLLLSQRSDLLPVSQGYWVGDCFLINCWDVGTLTGFALLGGVLLKRYWKPIILWSFDPDLAQTEHCPVQRYRLVLLSFISLLVVVSVKIIGSLLLPILLVVPAASVASRIQTPVGMLRAAIGMTAFDLLIGLNLSWQYDLPSGASVATTAIGMYGLISMIRALQCRFFKD
jgi:zinc transport system permease protein